jgi:peptidoglycan/xylan/chitin deacetylase (PgdA/CDA1 family)
MQLPPGMDHRHYAWSPLPLRGGRRWPQGGWMAAYAVLFLEHWELLPPPGALRDPRLVGEFGSFHPDYRSWTQREYGLRIGIYRVIEALQEAGIRPCVAANAMAVERLPRLVETLSALGCEWLGHGLAATRIMHSKMPRQEQAAHIHRSLEVLEGATGQRPRGWVSQDWGTSPDTFDLLAAAGVRYTIDLPNDEQPYWLRTEPALLAVPYSVEWDDVQCQWLRFLEPQAHARLAAEAFECMAADCEQQSRPAVFNVGIHPWLSGMPSRIAALRDLLGQLRANPGVWWTTPGEIDSAMREPRA